MFIPLFIAILLGLVSPSSTNNTCANSNSPVITTQDALGDSGENPPGDNTGGDTGQNPPPKID